MYEPLSSPSTAECGRLAAEAGTSSEPAILNQSAKNQKKYKYASEQGQFLKVKRERKPEKAAGGGRKQKLGPPNFSPFLPPTVDELIAFNFQTVAWIS